MIPAEDSATPHEALDLLVSGGTIITMDTTFRVIARGAIGIRDGRIVAVGAADDLAARYRATGTIDASGKIVMPGLVDAHAHAGHGLTKGIAEGRGGSHWLDLMEVLYHQSSTPDFWYAEGLLSACERLRFGVTTGLAMPGSSPRIDALWAAEGGVRAYEALGLRYILAFGPPNGPWPRTYMRWQGDQATQHTATLEEALATSEAAVQTFHGRGAGRIRVALGPSALASGRDDEALLQARTLRRLADRYQVPIHAHAYGGMVHRAARDFPELLGRNLSLAHCTGIDATEVRLLAEAGVAIIHGPYTHAFITDWCPVMELLDAGATVAIGTDGSSPDRSFDLLAQVHPAMQLQRVHYQDAAVLPAGKALAMITIDAARALGLADEIGSLEVGKQADLIVIDAQQPHLAPHATHPAQAPLRLAYAASGADVETVIVGGRVLLQDRRILTADVATVLADAQREAEAVLARADARGELDLPEGFWTATRYAG